MDKQLILDIISNNDQMERHEYEFIASYLGNKTFLVFGTGKDTDYWRICNDSGITYFLEDDDRWMQNKKDVIKVNYKTKRFEYQQLLNEFKEHNYKNLEMTLPNRITKTTWDVILVDAPQGSKDRTPGRMQSIFTAWKLADKSTTVFIHDCHREIENLYTKELFSESEFIKNSKTLKVAKK